MAATQTGIAAHDQACLAAEVARQAVYSQFPVQPPHQPNPPDYLMANTVKAADIAYHRAFIASAIQNGISPVCSIQALRELGTGGS